MEDPYGESTMPNPSGRTLRRHKYERRNPGRRSGGMRMEDMALLFLALCILVLLFQTGRKK